MKNYFVFIGIAMMLCVIGCTSDEVLENPTVVDVPVGLSAAPLVQLPKPKGAGS